MRICDGAMDFDVDFNNGDAGNTCCIIKSPLLKGAQKARSGAYPHGACSANNT